MSIFDGMQEKFDQLKADFEKYSEDVDKLIDRYSSELKVAPCPFCGHKPEDEMDFLHPTGSGWRDDMLGEKVMRHYMRANDPRGVHGRCWELNCLEHEGGCGASVSGDSREETIKKWNRRHS